MHKRLKTSVFLVVLLLLVPALAVALFTNGGFEGGDYSAWTKSTFLNYGLSEPQPFTGSSIVRSSGGSDQSVVVTAASPETGIDPLLGADATLKFPKYGTYSARVNGSTPNSVSNTVAQQATVTGADVDPTDGLIHIRFAYAPVLQDPSHEPHEQPYFYIRVNNVSRSNALLFEKLHFANEPGVPWKTSPLDSGVLYTDWTTADIVPGNDRLSVGDTVEIEVIGAACSLGGHFGYVYIDSFGTALLPGLSVSKVADKARVVGGDQLTYTITYVNGGSVTSTNTIVKETIPPQTSFISVSDPGCIFVNDVVTCSVGAVPPGGTGTFDVTVDVNTNASGAITNGSYTIEADGFAPTVGQAVSTPLLAITSLSPSSGPLAGGQVVTIFGTGFNTTAGATTVTFGATAATGVTCSSSTTCTAVSPPGVGTASVRLTTEGKTTADTPADDYTYAAPPTITSINPTIGAAAGGQSVTITGTTLSNTSSVTFGGSNATITGVTPTAITAGTPAHAAGVVNIVVTTPSGSATLTGGYTYVAPPAITNITPSSGPTAGGQSVTITGTNLSNATSVAFGASGGTITGNTANSITATTPAHAAGTVNVVVTTAGGSATSTAGYTFATPSFDGTFNATGPLGTPRENHTATLLSNGKVLIAGGFDGISHLSSAELYDPASETFSATGSMARGVYDHTATLLANGRVLIAGGNAGRSYAELYDPASGAFSATGPIGTARSYHTATLLPNGKVLITGGWGGMSAGYLSSAELYDPASSTFSATGALSTARSLHTATLLPNGKVLVAGGWNGSGDFLSSAELYDPASGTFSATGPMGISREDHTATLLPNGKVLLAGGYGSSEYRALAELYDPASGTFSATGSLGTPRDLHTATLLPSGRVLIAGGSNGNYLASAELYDPSNATFSAPGSMGTARGRHTETLLPNGKVLVAGGTNFSVLNSAELYNPAVGTPPTNVVATATTSTSVSITWSGTAGATYEALRVAAGGAATTVGSSTSGALTDNTASANTAYLYMVRAMSPSISPYSSPDLATTVIFTNPSLAPAATEIKAAHVAELRTAVIAVRALAGLTAGSFTDPTLLSGVTSIKAAHITDLRTALNAARSALLLPAASYTRPSIVAGTTTISAVDINDLRTGVR